MDLFSDQDVKDHLILEKRYLSAVYLQLFSNTWALLWPYMVLLWPLWAGQLSAHKICIDMKIQLVEAYRIVMALKIKTAVYKEWSSMHEA